MNAQRYFLAALLTVTVAACGDADTKDGNSNGSTNVSTNNVSTNNATTNNGSTNVSTNVTTNNGGTVTCNPTFGASDACGGDPIGTWALNTACVDTDDFAIDECPAATIEVTAISTSGTLTVDATTWAYDVSGTVELAASVPASCAAIFETCDNLGTFLEGTCVDAGGGDCDCTGTQAIEQSNTGTYVTEGGVAVVNDGEESWYFCAEGGQMSIREVEGDITPVYVGTM